MAIVRVLVDGPRNHVVHITGTAAESTTINPATMSGGGAPDGKQVPNDLSIEEIWFGSDTESIQLLWDATADELAWVIGSAGANTYIDFRDFGGLPNRSGAGKTGSLIVTSVGAANYSIVIHLKKKYP